MSTEHRLAMVRRLRLDRFTLLVAAATALVSPASAVEASALSGKSGPWIDGHRPHPSQVVVRFATSASVEAREALVSRLGLVERRSGANDYGVGIYDATGGARGIEAALRRDAIILDWGPVWIDPEGNLRYYVPGELTVQFEGNVTSKAGEALIRGLGARIVRRERTPGYYTIALPAGMGWAEAIRAFEAHDSVAFAEPSEIGFDDAMLIPNDPLFGVQWHHHNTGQEGGVPGADVSSTAAWDVTLGSPSVVIAVIDTGANLSHPDLVPNLLARGNEDWDFSNGPNRVPNDVNGHGTEVAGAAAARGNNELGVAGICPYCSIMPLKVNLADGEVQQRVNAINYLVAQALAHPERRYIGNCSWGQSGLHKGLNNALQSAYDNGVPIFFATGNGNQAEIAYPSSEVSVIAVGATSRCDERVSPTSCDAEEGWGSNYGSGLDLVAPGASIHTTCLAALSPSCQAAGGYANASGTSLASPIAAGTAGLLLSVNSQLNRAQIQSLLQARADDLVGPPAEDPPGPDIWMGWGRINAERALQPIVSCPGTGGCGGPNCQETTPPQCSEQNTGVTTCLGSSGVFSCPAGQTIWVSNCACSAVLPGYACPTQNQWWECR